MKRLYAPTLALLLLAGPVLGQPATSADIAAAIKAQSADGARLDAIGAKLDLLHSDLQALLAQLRAGGSVVAPAPGSAPVVAAVDPYFPPKPGDARFPSPENSRSLRVGNEIQGRPYLVDDSGLVFTLIPLVPGGRGLDVSGNRMAFSQWDEGNQVVQIIERSGKVYAQRRQFGWSSWRADQGNLYPGEPPAAVDPNAAPAPAAAPAAPVPLKASAIAPGSSGRVVRVGAGQQYATFAAGLAAARDGDTIDVGTTLIHEDIPVIAKAVLVKGGRFDCHDTVLAQGKGCLVSVGDVTYDGVEVWGAGIGEGEAGGTAAIRPAGRGHVTVRNARLHDNQNGIAGGGVAWVLAVSNTVLEHNGLGDGATHDLYASEGTVSVTLDKVTATNPRGGHAIKSRAPLTTITNSTLAARDATVIDISDGGVATISNSTVTKPAGSDNHGVIGLAPESTRNGLASTLVMTGGRLDVLCDSPFLQVAPSGTVTLSGVAAGGRKMSVVGGGKVVGMP